MESNVPHRMHKTKFTYCETFNHCASHHVSSFPLFAVKILNFFNTHTGNSPHIFDDKKLKSHVVWNAAVLFALTQVLCRNRLSKFWLQWTRFLLLD